MRLCWRCPLQEGRGLISSCWTSSHPVTSTEASWSSVSMLKPSSGRPLLIVSNSAASTELSTSSPSKIAMTLRPTAASMTLLLRS